MKPGVRRNEWEPRVAMLADLGGLLRAVGAKYDRALGCGTDPVAGELGQRSDRLKGLVDMGLEGVGLHGPNGVFSVDL